MTKEGSTSAPATGSHIVVDLGRKKWKQIKKLRKGQGKLMDEVSSVIQELKTAGKITGAAQPVIVVVREKKGTMKIPGLN
ncbi:MAG: hypothetical protein HY720_25795 [Planctomycetes bacterium]|nr:hypothetical protein [Planctomycetota bacterium]